MNPIIAIAIGFTGLYVLVTLRWLVGLCQRASRPMPKPGLLQLNPKLFEFPAGACSVVPSDPPSTNGSLLIDHRIAVSGQPKGADKRAGNFIFSRTTSALNPPCDNQRMAATVVEGTARKLVSTVNARTQRQSQFTGDSRKDGSFLKSATKGRI